MSKSSPNNEGDNESQSLDASALLEEAEANEKFAQVGEKKHSGTTQSKETIPFWHVFLFSFNLTHAKLKLSMKKTCLKL